MAQRINNPFPLFLDTDGSLLYGGYVYIGVAGQDPEANPLEIFWDKDLEVAITDLPLRTLGGMIYNGDSPAFVFADGDDYSIRVRNKDGTTVFFVSSIKVTGEQFQPLDSDLTAIAALSTTSYGRGLLTLANQAALRAATGIPDPLPAAGGNVSGNIVRLSAGPHIYWVDATFDSGRAFVTAHDGADPTSLEGDLWYKKAAP